MLVEPACGAALSTIYSGYIARLQLEGRLPRPANVVVIVGGGRNVSLRQLVEWEGQLNNFVPDHVNNTILPPVITSAYLSRTSPHTLCSDIVSKAGAIGHHLSSDPDDTMKLCVSSPSTPRPICTILNRTPATVAADTLDSHSPAQNTDRDGDLNNAEGAAALNPHDLVNFSKLLGSSEVDADEGVLRE